MPFVYKEITDYSLVPQCVKFHEEIFNLSIQDVYPAHFYSMIIRKEFPLGFIIGCFHEEKNKLAGLAVVLAGMQPDTVYCPIAGIRPEYKVPQMGYNLIYKMLDTAYTRGKKTLFGICDPLDAGLGKLFTYLGATFYKYIETPYNIANPEEIVIDKIFLRTSTNVSKSIQQYKKQLLVDLLKTYPIVENSFIDAPSVLFEIPNNVKELEKENKEKMIEWRKRTRIILKEYITKRGYKLTRCLSGLVNNERKTYYIINK